MDYIHFTSNQRSARGAELGVASGIDFSGATHEDAKIACIEACKKEIQVAFYQAHASGATPTDPDFAAMQKKADRGIAPRDAARALAEALATQTGWTEGPAVMQEILDTNRLAAEKRYFDYKWHLDNASPTPEQRENLEVECARAEREAEVIDNWGN